MRCRLQCLVLLGMLLSGLDRYPLAAQTGDSLPPPRTGLVRVNWPDLSSVEPDVREQLAALQKALTSTATSREATASILSEAYGALGQHYQVYALNSPSRECYLNASRLAPKDFRWVYLLGTLDQHEDRVAEAIEHYRQARTLRPDYVPAAVNMGNVLLQMNRPEDAEPNFRAALAIDADSAAAHYGLGQIALSRRDYAEAITRFETVLTLVPGANRIHYALAMAYRGAGDTDQAKAHLARQGTVGVRVDDPLLDGLQALIRSERIHLARGKAAADSGRYADAADEFREALAANANSLTAHVNLGAVLVQTGEVDGAAEHFEAALRIDPKNTNAHYNLAILLSKSSRHDAAVRHLQAVVGSQPDDLEARFLLAQELWRAQRFEEALASLNRLADLGRCAEAAEWQRRTIAAARQAQNADLVAKLESNLKLYDAKPQCRP